MTRGVKFRRGSTSDHSNYTGLEGEITVNTDKDCLVVHDGTTLGGFEQVSVASTQTLTNKTLSNPAISGVTTITSSNNTVAALRITQTGSANALLVEDSANPDATPFVVGAAGSVGIGTTNPLYSLSVVGSGATASTFGLSGGIADFTGNSSTYTQINLRNTDSGSGSSADFIVTADNGTDTTNYIDLGINNSGFTTSPSWAINNGSDGYLYTASTNLAVGVGVTNKSLSLFVGLSSDRGKVTINNTGVGIGSTQPRSVLDSVGLSTFTGTVGINSIAEFSGGVSGVTTVTASPVAGGSLFFPPVFGTLAMQATDIDYETPGTYTYIPGEVAVGSTSGGRAMFHPKYYMIQIVGAGGGGASGTCGALGSNIPGGGGGSGGGGAIYWVPGYLVGSMSIQVGAGGTGGASVISATGVAGVAGANGAASSVTITSPAGLPGVGGAGLAVTFTAPGGLGAVAPALTGTSSAGGVAPPAPVNVLDGLLHLTSKVAAGTGGGTGAGGGGVSAVGAAGTNVISSSGGGGAGGNTSLGAASLGSAGGTKLNFFNTTLSAVAAGSSQGAGQNASAVGGADKFFMNGWGLGGAGGAGAGTTGPLPNTGGSGGIGLRGGGGGGGGASKITFASGAGGNGGDGYIRIFAFG